MLERLCPFLPLPDIPQPFQLAHPSCDRHFGLHWPFAGLSHSVQLCGKLPKGELVPNLAVPFQLRLLWGSLGKLKRIEYRVSLSRTCQQNRSQASAKQQSTYFFA